MNAVDTSISGDTYKIEGRFISQLDSKTATINASATKLTLYRTSTGPRGIQGPIGPRGVGVPLGGITNSVLTKTSGSDRSVEWRAPLIVTDITPSRNYDASIDTTRRDWSTSTSNTYIPEIYQQRTNTSGSTKHYQIEGYLFFRTLWSSRSAHNPALGEIQFRIWSGPTAGSGDVGATLILQGMFAFDTIATARFNNLNLSTLWNTSSTGSEFNSMGGQYIKTKYFSLPHNHFLTIDFRGRCQSPSSNIRTDGVGGSSRSAAVRFLYQDSWIQLTEDPNR